MVGIVEVLIPVDAAAAVALNDERKREAIGRIVSRILQPRPDHDPLLEAMERFAAVAPLATVQPPLNLFERDAERDILPWCLAHGVGTLTYGALCRGLLTGTITATTRFKGDDLRRNDPKFQQPRFPQYLAAVAALDRYARMRYDRQGRAVERVPAGRAIGARGHDALRLQDRQMMRHRRLLEVERGRQVLDAALALGEQAQDGEAALMRHRLEEFEQGLGHGSKII